MSDLRERCLELMKSRINGSLDSTYVNDLDALEAFAKEEAWRAIQDFIHGRDKLCLNCGAKEPCDLKDDPQSPCTFDPTPMELLKALRKKNLAERIKGMETASAVARECHSPFAARTIDAEISKLKERIND